MRWRYYRIKSDAIGKESIIDILTEELGCLVSDIEFVKEEDE